MKQLIYAAYFLCILFATGSHAASFDCTKASTLVEKTICSDAKLSELDSQLMQSYKKALASSPDASGMKSAQRTWLTGVRNKCTDAACLNRVYTDRLKELSGAEFETPTLSKEPESSSASDSNKSPVEIALAKNATKISALGFSNKWLKAPIYLRGDAVNPPNHFVIFENLLAMLFENPRFSKITAIKSGKFEGFRLKVKGAESSGLLFRFDEGDLFISHVVGGDDELTPLETAMDYVSLSMLVVQLAPDAIQRVK